MFCGLFIEICIPNCKNGGDCVAPFKCKCKIGYTGAICENGEINIFFLEEKLSSLIG